MRVTMVGTYPPIKGISEYCVMLAGAVGRLIDVDFVSFSHIYPEALYPGGTKEGGEVPRPAAGARVSVRRSLDWFNPAGWLWTGMTASGCVLHIQWWTYFLAPVEITILAGAKLRGIPAVMTVHNVLGHETNAADRALSRAAFSFADRFIVHTEENRRQMIEVFGVGAGRVTVIPYGPLGLYADAEVSREEARRKLGLEGSERVMLFFGAIRDYKGLDVLLRALRTVADAAPNVTLVVAGTCWGGWEKYRRIIEEMGLERRVRLCLGYVPSSMVKVYFRAADLAVLPYVHFEGQSGVGNIATAFGTPMVVTRTGGLPSLVREEEAVATPGDEGALARALVACLADDERLARMSADSAAIGRETSWDRIAERTVQLYREL
jgi:glycosyltransferase involved in cell wall biosynthesis